MRPASPFADAACEPHGPSGLRVWDVRLYPPRLGLGNCLQGFTSQLHLFPYLLEQRTTCMVLTENAVNACAKFGFATGVANLFAEFAQCRGQGQHPL
jgi:hypothetical protein